MSNKTNDISSVELDNNELTNWQKIDELEAELERSKPKKKKRLGGMRFKRIFDHPSAGRTKSVYRSAGLGC